jgi:hypothetical protein
LIVIGKDKADFYGLVPVILRELLYRMNDDNKEVLVSANKSMALLTNCVPAEELVNHIEFCRNMIASTVSDARRRKGGVGDGAFLMPGFNIPNGTLLLSRCAIWANGDIPYALLVSFFS